jgi:hypothetical protein
LVSWTVAISAAWRVIAPDLAPSGTGLSGVKLTEHSVADNLLGIQQTFLSTPATALKLSAL